MLFSALRSLFTDSPGNPSVMGALGDPQFRQEVAGNARDASVRGAVAGALGAPVDMANSIANLGTAAYGYLGNKMGLLSGSEMPPLYQNPVGGSEWIGNQMQKAGIIGGNRNPYAEAAASIGFPMMGGALEARIPQMDRALAQAGENLAANGSMNTGQYMGQRGAVGAAGDPKLMEEVRRRGLDMSQEARMARAVEKSAAKPVLHAAPNVVNMNNIPNEKEGHLRLYHGGYKEGFTSVPDSSTTAGFSFDGLFAHPEKQSSWGAHGNGSNYFADIKEPEILTQNALDYHIPYENTVAALKKAMPWLNDNDVDLAHSAVIEDKNVHDMDANDVSRVFRADDPGQASWEAQRLRGNVARNLGYKAVEMGDEHGTSYLMMPGVPLTQVIETDSSNLSHAHGGQNGLARQSALRALRNP